MIIIGDVHGRIADYLNIINSTIKNSIQLGDFGFKKKHDYFINNFDTNKHKICFGNHDYYPYLNKKHSLGNYSIFNNIMTIRGALSQDKYLRKEGTNWFKEEELSYTEFCEIVSLYEKEKPKIIISHDCPYSFKTEYFGYTDINNTSKNLEFLLTIHKPQLWIFGHYHQSVNERFKGINFICLDELETIEL